MKSIRIQTSNVMIRTGLGAAFLMVVLQWFTVMGFIAHSCTLWLKTGDPAITVAIDATILFSVGSIAAVVFSLWAHGKLCEQRSRLRYVAQLIGLAGLSGLLVFFGMASVGYVLLVHR